MQKPFKPFKWFIVLFFFAALLPGCVFLTPQPPDQTQSFIYPVTPSQHPEYTDDINFDGLEYSIHQSLTYLNRLPSSKEFNFGSDTFDTDHMIKSCETFLTFIKTKPNRKQLNKFIKTNYRVYKSAGAKKSRQVIFTGYYEPILQGSLHKSERYPFPIYARPSDLAVIDLSLFSERYKGKRIIGRYTDPEFVPYSDRKDIESKGFSSDITQPLAWVSDKVDLFFLQIQGSGKIFLDSGQTINVHYHISNGRPYKSIGNYLIKKGEIPLSEMSMQKIKEYLHQNPDEIDAVLNYNPSYVFFQLEEEGPLGALGVTLTPGRSIAIDRDIFPSAGLAFIEIKIPIIDGDANIHRWASISRFVLAQDTGGAIKGPGRADLFWGNGPYAEIAAGNMKHPGNLYFLVLKPKI